MRAGMDPEAFWYRTPREIDRYLSAVGERHSDDLQLAILASWHTALYTRAKKLPKLKTELDRFKPARREPLPFDQEIARWEAFFGRRTGNA